MAFHFDHRKLLSHLVALSKCDDCRSSILKKSNKIPTPWILVFCFLGGVVVLFGYYMILRKYRMYLNNRNRSLHHVENTHQELLDENQGPAVFHPIWLINTVGLQETIIESITVFKYKKNDALVEGTDCSVCLSEFEEDESLRLLPKCSHAFHIPCIDTWLRSHKNCPLCRAPIVCENAQVSTLEPNHRELGSIEEAPLENSENHVSESSESSVRAEEVKIDEILETNSHNLNGRVLSDLVNHSRKMDEGFEPVRRSVSMDAAAASVIYLAVANEGSSNNQMVLEKKPNVQVVDKKNERNSSLYRVMKSCSFGRSLPKGPIKMKRSFSSSEKSHKNRYSRSHDSILPL